MNAMLMAAVLASGCSFVATKGPGNWTPESKRAPVCDTSYGGPRGIDIGIAAGSYLAVGGVLDAKEMDSATRGALIGGLLLISVGAIASIVVGRGRVRECRAAREDWKRTAPTGE